MSAPKKRNISQQSELIYDCHNFSIILDTREIFLHSNLETTCEEAYIDHYCANLFIRNLRLLDSVNHNPILVHMITNGGEWNYGMAIYDAILASPSEITILAYAHARSMSSIIPQAAQYRVIMPNADVLIHWGTEYYDGNYTSVQSEAEWSRQCSKIMVDIYANRCKNGAYFKGWTINRIKKWLSDQMTKKQEFYMTPQEAVNKGFMDGIFGEKKYENYEMLRNGV